MLDQGYVWLMFGAGGFLLFAGMGLMYWLMEKAKSNNRPYIMPDTSNWELVIETKTYRPQEVENSDAGLEYGTR